MKVRTRSAVGGAGSTEGAGGPFPGSCDIIVTVASEATGRRGITINAY